MRLRAITWVLGLELALIGAACDRERAGSAADGNGVTMQPPAQGQGPAAPGDVSAAMPSATDDMMPGMAQEAGQAPASQAHAPDASMALPTAGSSGRGDGTDGGLGGPADAGTPAPDGGDASRPPDDDDRCAVAVLDPAQPPRALQLSGNLGTHDPTAIERDGMVYILQTGGDFGTRLPGKLTTDMRAMDGNFGALGSNNPGWVGARVPQARNLWAPDLSYFGGLYHLYYSASSFGSNTSCMGHATSTAIGDEPFEDHGPVMCSSGGDNFNAIDPNVVLDFTGTPWLFFGSFWDGIRAVRLDTDGARADDQVHRIASRGGGAIEAPVVVRRCGFYYLFVSFDSCCQGARSTYNIRVGRSEQVLGPYVDRQGRAMLEGGGSLLVEGDATFAAAGHNAVLFRGESAFNLYHAYRRSDGQPQLRVAELAWDADGWPVSGGP